ncbi:MAG TPA: MarC family protein [Acidobacteriaceae bacterium]|jgi:multiple antibiotic resistance protein|nr:MarC family protein [Acidobacteriaceae bacterium]
MLVWETFLLAFSALLPLINPLGTALVFVGLVGDAPAATYRRLARKIAINNVIFLAIVELLGSAILNFFGISLPIVQLSGGVVIAAIGWGVLNENDASAAASSQQKESDARGDDGTNENGEQALDEKAFYPFTFPVTSGPGVMVVMLTLTAHISERGLTKEVLGHVGVFLAVVVLSALVYVCYGYAPKITKAISPSTAHGILRVVAFILLCIGVQIAWNGLSVLLKSVVG